MALPQGVIDEIKSNPKKLYYKADHKLNLEPNMKDELFQYWDEIKQTSKQYLPQDFYKGDLPADVIAEVEQDPAKLLKKSVEKLSQSGMKPELVEFWSQIKGKSIQSLVSKGKNPQALLEEKTPIMGFIQNVGNVLSVPGNALANIVVPGINEITKIPASEGFKQSLEKIGGKYQPLDLTPPDIWGGSWVDVFSQVSLQKDPKYKAISDKLSYDQELTEEEEKYYKTKSIQHLVKGIVGDIFIDPTTYIGNFIGKAKKVANLSKLSKADVVTDVGKSIANYGTDMYNTLYKASDGLKNLDVIKNVLNVTDNATVLKTMKKIKFLSDGILSKTVLKVGDIGTIKTLYSDVEKAFKLGKQFKLNGNSVKTMEKFLSSIDAAKANKFLPVYEKIAGASSKIKQGVMKVGKAIIPKPIQYLGQKLRHLFGSDVSKAYTPAFKAAKNAKGMLGYYGDTIANTINYGAKGDGGFKGLLTLQKQYKVKEPEMMVLLSNIVETGDTANYVKKYGKLVDELKPMAKFVNETFKDVLIKELQSGVKTIPLGVGKDAGLMDEFTKLSDEYTKLYKINPTHPQLKQMETSIKGIVDKGSELAKINYLPRVLTDEGKAIFKMEGDAIPAGLELPTTLKGTHTSQLQRVGFEEMPIANINKAVNQGASISGMTGKFQNVPEFAGKDLFKTNIPELIKARWNKAGFAIQQNVLKEGLADLVKESDAAGLKLFYRAGENLPSKDFVNVGKILGFGDEVIYAPIEVAKEIEKMNKINPTGKFIQLYDKVLKFLQRITLIPIPAFHTRNEVSNIYAMLTAGWNPLDLKGGFKAAKLSAQILGNSKVSFVDGRGVIHTANNIKELALKHGLMGTDFLTQSLGEGINAGFNPFKAAAQKAGKAGLLGKVPAAYMGFMETSGRWLEEHAKLTLFIDSLLKGDTPLEAANIAKKYLFDYTDLTRFESDVVKRIAFFYTWMRKNIGLQLKNLVEGNPVQKAIFKTVTAVNKQQPETVIDPRFQSEYMKGTPFLSLGKDKAKNEQTLLGLEGYLPPFNLQQPARIIGNALTKGDFSETLSMVNPLIKAPIEIAANQNTFTKKPIKKSSGDTDVFMGIPVDPYFGYIVRQIRILTIPNQLLIDKDVPSAFGYAPVGQELSPSQKAQLALVGKPATINVATQKVINQSLITKDMLAEINNIVSDTYALPNVYRGVSPSATLNDLYNRVVKIQNMYDTYVKEGKLDEAKAKKLKGMIKYAWKRYYTVAAYYGGGQ